MQCTPLAEEVSDPFTLFTDLYSPSQSPCPNRLNILKFSYDAPVTAGHTQVRGAARGAPGGRPAVRLGPAGRAGA
eukprot:474893-Hanusia_phi.AAC.1